MKKLLGEYRFGFLNRLSLCIFMVHAFSAMAIESQFQNCVDKVVAIVGCGPNKKIITSSEIGKPDIFVGIEALTLDQIIDQKIILLEAESFKIGNFKITVSPAEIDSKIERAKVLFGVPGISNEKFNNVLEQKGLTIEILKDQAYQEGMISHMMAFMFPDKAIVSSERILEFCKKNPEITDEQVRLHACEIGIDEFLKLKSKFTLKDGKLDIQEFEKSLNLVDLGLLNVQELEKETLSVLDKLQIGGLHVPEVPTNSTQEKVRILKLVERNPRREKTIDERKAKVSEILYLEDRAKKHSDYIDELRGQTHVVRFGE